MSQVIRLQDLMRKAGNCDYIYLNGKNVYSIPEEELGNPLVHIDLVELLADFESQYDYVPGVCVYAYCCTII